MHAGCRRWHQACTAALTARLAHQHTPAALVTLALCRVLAPALYIFFASALPALAFGQQLATDTEGRLNVVHVLAASALSGLAQVHTWRPPTMPGCLALDASRKTAAHACA